MIAAMRFSRSPCPWKVTAALNHHRQRADSYLFKNAPSIGAVEAVVVPVGLAFVVITIVVAVISVMIPSMLLSSHEA
jgi:hypothetical protein